MGASDVGLDGFGQERLVHRDRSHFVVVETVEDLESEADLIVIGYRKRSSVGKALLGSQAQEIMMGAPCPVLATMEG